MFERVASTYVVRGGELVLVWARSYYDREVRGWVVEAHVAEERVGTWGYASRDEARVEARGWVDREAGYTMRRLRA